MPLPFCFGLLVLVVTLVGGVTSSAEKQEKVTTVDDDVDEDIVRAADPEVSSSTTLPTLIAAAAGDDFSAAHLLAETLGGITVVVEPAKARGKPHIAIGFEAAHALGVPMERLGLLGDDGYVIISTGSVPTGSIAVGASCGSLRGSVNGVYALLRDLGFHTLAPNVTLRPVSMQLPAGPGWNLTIRPPFHEREVMADGVADCCCVCAPTNVSGALGFNGIHAHGPVAIHNYSEWQNRYAVGVQVAQSTANVFDLLAPDPLHPCRRAKPVPTGGGTQMLCPSVFEAHPDWFVCRNVSNRTAAEPLGATVYPCNSLELVNKPWEAQPCWSHPTLVATLTRAIRMILNKTASVLHPIATVSQMDGNALICPLDKAINAAENTSGGAQFRAINSIVSESV